MTLRAAAYARISTDDDTVPKVQYQLADCQRIVSTHGYQLEEKWILADDGIPATGQSIRQGTRDKRPQFDKLLKGAERGEFDVIVVTEGERLARNYPDGMALIDACVVGGVIIHTVTDGLLDPRTPGGEEQAMSVFVGGRREVRTRSARQRRRYSAELEQGKPLWGRRTFGFAGVEELNRHGKTTHRWTLHEPDEAEAIRWAVEFFLSPEGTIYGIMGEFTKRHLTTTAAGYKRRKPVAGELEFDGHWSYSGVKSLLRNPRIAGVRSEGGQVVYGDDGEPLAAAWEPIVTFSDWQAVQDKLNDKKRRTNPGRKPSSLGSGIVMCVCGLPMRATTIKGIPREGDDRTVQKLPGLRCDVGRSITKAADSTQNHVSVRADDLDPLLASAVASAFLFGPSQLTAEAADIGPIDAELSALRATRAKFVSLIGRELLTEADAAVELRSINLREAELEEQRQEAVSRSTTAAMHHELRAAMWTGKSQSISKAAEAKTALIEKFQSLPLSQRRELVRLLLDVRVMPGQGVKTDPAKRIKITHREVASLNEERVQALAV